MISISAPPAGYGPAKRALFNLGTRAYREPESFKRAVFDVASDLIGVPLWMVNLRYDFGGIRRDIVRSLYGSEDFGLCFRQGDPPSAAETEKRFLVDHSAPNTDLRMLVSAVRMLDRTLECPRFRKTLMIGSLVSFFAFAGAASRILINTGSFLESVPLFAAAAASARLGLHINDARERRVRALTAFIANTDRELLIRTLPRIQISWMTWSILHDKFYFAKDRDMDIIDMLRAIESGNEPRYFLNDD